MTNKMGGISWLMGVSILGLMTMTALDGVNTLPAVQGGNHTDSLVYDCHAPSFLAQEQ